MRHFCGITLKTLSQNNHIIDIFLVPDESFNVRCQEIISALNIRGKIQILPKGKEEVASSVIEQTTSIADEDLKKEEIQASVITQEVSNEDESFKDIVDNSPHQTINNSPKIVDIVEYQKRLQDRQNVNFDTADSALEEKNTSTDYSYRAENNANNVFTKEVFNNMGYNSSKEMSKGKSLVRVKKNSAGIVSLPVIIFILSALLLIVSAVLLFIVE